jgi:hypothetical protein
VRYALQKSVFDGFDPGEIEGVGVGVGVGVAHGWAGSRESSGGVKDQMVWMCRIGQQGNIPEPASASRRGQARAFPWNPCEVR